MATDAKHISWISLKNYNQAVTCSREFDLEKGKLDCKLYTQSQKHWAGMDHMSGSIQLNEYNDVSMNQCGSYVVLTYSIMSGLVDVKTVL